MNTVSRLRRTLVAAMVSLVYGSLPASAQSGTGHDPNLAHYDAPPYLPDITLIPSDASGKASGTVSRAERSGVLKFTLVDIKEGATVKEMLTKGGIRPGASAYAVLYELNPALRHVDELSIGDRIWLPVVKKALVKTSAPDGLVGIEANSGLRTAVGTTLRNAEVALDRAATRLDQLVPDPDRRARVQALITRNRQLGGFGAFAGSPAAASTLGMISVEAGALPNLVHDSGANNPLSDADADALITTLTDVAETRECAKTNTKCEFPVSVVTLNGAMVDPGYDIMAAPFFQADDVTCTVENLCIHPFRIGSSPARDEFAPATFKIWATKAGKVVSAKKVMHVKRDGVNDFDLQINHGP